MILAVYEKQSNAENARHLVSGEVPRSVYSLFKSRLPDHINSYCAQTESLIWV